MLASGLHQQYSPNLDRRFTVRWPPERTVGNPEIAPRWEEGNIVACGRFASGRFRSCDEWMLRVNFRQASYRIDCSILVSEFRFRTKIGLPIAIARIELTYESAT
jgi:hypothetical protein